jgi:hypothetical protein
MMACSRSSNENGACPTVSSEHAPALNIKSRR